MNMQGSFKKVQILQTKCNMLCDTVKNKENNYERILQYSKE